MPTYPAPSPPVVGDGVPNVHSGDNNHPIELVIIHSAVMACEPGAAEALGRMNQTSTTGSWHYSTDPQDVRQCSFDRFVCWGDGVNLHRLHIEMADWPAPLPDGPRPKRWWANLKRSWRWATKAHRLMLRNTARLTAEALLANGLPTRYVSARGQRKGHRGWSTHAASTKAFRMSTHWDPGLWPRRRFGRLVDKYADEIRAEARA